PKDLELPTTAPGSTATKSQPSLPRVFKSSVSLCFAPLGAKSSTSARVSALYSHLARASRCWPTATEGQDAAPMTPSTVSTASANNSFFMVRCLLPNSVLGVPQLLRPAVEYICCRRQRRIGQRLGAAGSAQELPPGPPPDPYPPN